MNFMNLTSTLKSVTISRIEKKLMGKIFRAKTRTTIEQNEILKNFSQVYKTFYNKSLEVQLKNRKYAQAREDQFMSLEDIDIEVTKSKIEFPFKYDEGIRSSAIIHAKNAFYTWWDRYLTNLKKTSIGDSPRFIKKSKYSFFFTTSLIKVNKNGLSVSNLGYVKLLTQGYVPFGEYKNVRFTFDGNFWRVQLESNFEINIEQLKPKMDNLDISIYSDGSLAIGELEIPSVLEAESMIPRLEKYKEAKEQLERKIKLSKGIPANKKPKSIDKAKVAVRRAKNSIENEKIRLYNSLVNAVLCEAPAKIFLRASLTDRGEEQLFSSDVFRDTKIKMFVRMLKKKVELYGIKVETEGIKSEVFC